MQNRHQTTAGLILLGLALVFGLWQGSVMQAHRIAADSLNKQAANLHAVQTQLLEDHKDLKVSVSGSRLQSAQSLSRVFPAKESLTDLTRLLDDFATKNHFETNPFFISSLHYQEAQTSEDGKYSMTPLVLNVTTSRKNLERFLDFIDQSGSLESNVRLMSVESMSMTFPEQFGGAYDVTFLINAYFNGNG